MLAFIARRVAAWLPALIVFVIGMFVAVSVVPPPQNLSAEERARRFLHLPMLFNVDPDDRPRIVLQLVIEAAKGEGESRRRAIERLLQIGAAGVPELAPALDKLDVQTRTRIARELAPLAFRMGVEEVADLDVPAKAEKFWRRVLDERGPELRQATIRRALRRHLADRAEPLYARELRNADTAALSAYVDALDGKLSPNERETIEALAVNTAQRAGALSVIDAASLQRWWTAHRTDYIEYDGLERFVARVVETRFGRWIVHAVANRFGRSWRTDQPVLDDIARRAPGTLSRVFFAMFLAYALAIPLGTLAAARRGGPSDRVSTTALLFLHALPVFVLALIARAASPRLARTDGFLILALAIVALAPIARHVRASVLDVSRQDYVRTAIAKGTHPLTLWGRYVLRNALPPIVARAAVEVPLTVAAAIVAEEVLGKDGLGVAAVAAIRARDLPWLMAFTGSAVLFGGLMLVLADIAQAALDPRVRAPLSLGRSTS